MANMTMLEKMAWTLCPFIRGDDACKKCPASVETGYGRGTAVCRREAERAARLAIEAMREPSEAMLNAMLEAEDQTPWGEWTAGIDAILAETQDGKEPAPPRP